MVWKQFELLEEKIEILVQKHNQLLQEKTTFSKQLSEKETGLEQMKEQLAALEEERDLIRAKIDEILKKIGTLEF